MGLAIEICRVIGFVSFFVGMKYYVNTNVVWEMLVSLFISGIGFYILVMTIIEDYK